MKESLKAAHVSEKPGTDVIRRVLRRRDLILFGLAVLTPTAVFPVYGIIQTISHGQAALSYLAAMVAMLFTAASYGKMATVFPSAGSTYAYVQKTFNPHVGFFAGWAMVLDYFLIPLTSVVYGSLTANRLIPSVPYLFWAILFTIGMTIVNILGIELLAGINNFMVGVMIFVAVVFVGAAIYYVDAHYGSSALISSVGILQPHGFAADPLLRGASIATLSYIGFDTVSTLAEDSINPEKDIGFSTVMACFIQTVVCIVIVYFTALAWNDYRSFPLADTAIFDIGRRIGGEAMFLLVSGALLVAGVSSALTGQAGSSRLLFAMGRDGVLPRPVFGRLHHRFGTPTRAIYVMSGATLAFVIGVKVLLPHESSFQIAVEMLNFGAFVGFILVNLSVIQHHFITQKHRAGLGNVLHNLLFPLAGALGCIYIWWNLSPHAKVAGFTWLGVGVVYLAFHTRGFRRPLSQWSGEETK